MNKRKIALFVVAALLIGLIAVGATLAYFTDKDNATNVVTMGHVDIDLTETSEDGKVTSIDDNGIVFDDVLPGDIIEKIPTVTVQPGSADCYIRVKMNVTTGENSTITAADLALLKDQLIDQITEDGTWAYNAAEDYFYCTTLKSAADAVDLFQNVSIPAAWVNNVADQTFSIELLAEAIQADHITYNAADVCWADEEGNNLIGVSAVAIEDYVEEADA